MADTPPPPPAGWYPGPDGQKRYWSGDQWLNLPAPESHAEETVEVERAPERSSRRKLFVLAGVLALLLLAGGVGAAVWKANSDAAAQEEAAAVAAQAEADAEDAQNRRDEAERKDREAAVPGIEDSVRKMAEEHVTEEIIDGPVIDVTCSPVGGGSTDDLSERTTVFQCFVANEDNGDGTMSGYYYNATMNWDTGSYTYGFGEP